LDIFWFALVFLDIFWFALVFLDIFWFALLFLVYVCCYHKLITDNKN